MPEYWIEENIQPISHQDSDRLLIDELEPLIIRLKRKGVVSWHFLREGDGWRINQNIPHLRLRFQAGDIGHLKKVRKSLKRKLDGLRRNRSIVDHYVGCHGKPVRYYKDYYCGEAVNFDERARQPVGWNLVKKSLEVGSELALLLIKGRLNRIQLGSEFEFYKISHLFPNQCRHYPGQPNFQIIRTLPNWPANLIVYDIANPTP
jgi:hypothetical protein